MQQQRALLLLTLLSASYAAWIGGDGNWNTASAWTGGVVPISVTSPIINALGNYTVLVNTPVTIVALTLGVVTSGLSHPILLIDGVVFNVGMIALHSGDIILKNGAQLVTAVPGVPPLVSSDGIDKTTIQALNDSITVNVNVVSGSLGLIGNINLPLPTTFLPGSELSLYGNHVLGAAFLTSGGTLTINPNATITLPVPVVVGTLKLLGGVVMGVNYTLIPTLTATTFFVDATVNKAVVATSLFILTTTQFISGTLQTINNAAINALGGVMYATNGTFTLAANVISQASPVINQGRYILQNITVPINTTVQAGATLVLDSVTLASGIINNYGTIVVSNIFQIGQNLSSMASIVGGQVQSTAGAIYANGTLTLNQVTFTGYGFVLSSATIVLDKVNISSANLQGPGMLVIPSTVNSQPASNSTNNNNNNNNGNNTPNGNPNSVILGTAYVQILGQLISAGNTTIQSAILNGTITVVNGGQLVLDSVNYVKGKVNNSALVVITGVNTFLSSATDKIEVINGIVQFSSLVNTTIAAGQLYIEKAIASGTVFLATPASLILQNVNITTGAIWGLGKLIIDEVVYIASPDIVTINIANLTNTGIIDVTTGTLSLQGNTPLNGQYSISKDGVFDFAGNIIVNAETNITGNIRVTKGYLSATTSALTVVGNATLQNTAQLITSKDFQVIDTLNVADAAILSITGGKAMAGSLSLGPNSVYQINYADNISHALDVTGNANLGGNLIVTLPSGYNIQEWGPIVVMNYGSHSGTFSKATGVNNVTQQATNYGVNYGQNSASLQQAAETSANTPNPTSMSSSSVLQVAFVLVASMLVVF